MTDSEFIRMRQAEGRSRQPEAGELPAERPSRRIAALMRLARQARGRSAAAAQQRRP